MSADRGDCYGCTIAFVAIEEAVSSFPFWRIEWSWQSHGFRDSFHSSSMMIRTKRSFSRERSRRVSHRSRLLSFKMGNRRSATFRGIESFGVRKVYAYPHLLLLDPNLPRKSGWELLRWLRSRPELARLCLFVLTNSTNQCDRALFEGADYVYAKPAEFHRLKKQVRAMAIRRRMLEAGDGTPRTRDGASNVAFEEDRGIRYRPHPLEADEANDVGLHRRVPLPLR